MIKISISTVARSRPATGEQLLPRSDITHLHVDQDQLCYPQPSPTHKENMKNRAHARIDHRQNSLLPLPSPPQQVVTVVYDSQLSDDRCMPLMHENTINDFRKPLSPLSLMEPLVATTPDQVKEQDASNPHKLLMTPLYCRHPYHSRKLWGSLKMQDMTMTCFESLHNNHPHMPCTPLAIMMPHSRKHTCNHAYSTNKHSTFDSTFGSQWTFDLHWCFVLHSTFMQYPIACLFN